jgi:hypothetical protein
MDTADIDRKFSTLQNDLDVSDNKGGKTSIFTHFKQEVNLTRGSLAYYLEKKYRYQCFHLEVFSLKKNTPEIMFVYHNFFGL